MMSNKSLFCLLQIFALRHHYFKNAWNVFDLVVVILSIIGIAMDKAIKNYFVQVRIRKLSVRTYSTFLFDSDLFTADHFPYCSFGTNRSHTASYKRRKRNSNFTFCLDDVTSGFAQHWSAVNFSHVSKK